MMNNVRIPATLLLAIVAVAATGCRNTLFDSPQPEVRSTMALHTRAGTGDTVQLTIALGEGPVRALGSITGEVTGMSNMRFVECTGAQGEPLLACKAHEQSVRIASAWVAGTHAGDLLTLTFVRTSPAAQPAWQLSLREAHDVGGKSVLEALDVLPDATPAMGSAR